MMRAVHVAPRSSADLPAMLDRLLLYVAFFLFALMLFVDRPVPLAIGP